MKLTKLTTSLIVALAFIAVTTGPVQGADNQESVLPTEAAIAAIPVAVSLPDVPVSAEAGQQAIDQIQAQAENGVVPEQAVNQAVEQAAGLEQGFANMSDQARQQLGDLFGGALPDQALDASPITDQL